MKRYLTLLTALIATMTGMAQTANDTINRMVLVESTYNPIIAGAVKHSFIPEEVKPSMSKEKVVYADEKVDITHFDRMAQPAQPVAVDPEKGNPGYAHLGYGNYNALNALAGYKWRFDKSGNLALKARTDGWNGKFRLDDDTRWRSYRYDMAVGADYDISMGNTAINAGVRMAHYDYNYLTFALPEGHTDKQQANSLGAHISMEGAVKEHYYYRAAVSYNRSGRSTYLAHKLPHSESHVASEVAVGMDLYKWGIVKVLLQSDVLTYQGLTDYRNYHALAITPLWDYRHGKFLFTAGFNMDFLQGKHIEHPLQLSPECRISYIPDSRFALELTLDGGRDIHTFGKLYARSPYWMAAQQLQPSYTYVNAHLDGSVRVTEGLHLHVGGGYKVMADALLEVVADSAATRYTGMTNHDVQVATANMGASYTYKDVVSLSARGEYHHWMMQGDRAMLARAPKLKVDVDARVRIMPKLYAYTGLKMMTFTHTGVAERESAIVDWSLGAQYSLNRRFTFFADAHNLLNRRYHYYTGYPAQGFNVLMGAMATF